MNLVIIEGAGKKETIEKYLGTGYRVFATKGHVRDLPQKGLAINVSNNFEPKYAIMPDKKDIVDDLIKRAKNADQIFLATDPDREGEAISWHLSNILGIPEGEKVRIVFNEISKKAINEALKQPREININLVDAQQARRVLDRLVGYKVSPILCKKIQNKLSAGRVQSVALRLVVDREREIQAFVPQEYWDIFAFLKKQNSDTVFKSQLHSYNGKKIQITDKIGSDEVLANLKDAKYIVDKIKKSTSISRASAPFITSTLQQEALGKLGMSLKQTQQAAQELYEGVNLGGEGKTALVTYIRTDSTRVSKEAQDEAREFIRQHFGSEYVPPKPNFFKSKSQAQDAHEAIRPISINRTPESLRNMLSKQNYRLYKLIYDRFLASQMADSVADVVTVDINANDYTFRATGKTITFKGYLAAYSYKSQKGEEEGEESDDKKLPQMEVGDVLDLKELKCDQKFTKPPARYTEASLIKAMEEKGIGRPATYTPTIMTILSRAYVVREARTLVPTELGIKVVDMLVRYFEDIMDVGFTADMETKLDDIEEGGKVWQKVVSDFYGDFSQKLKFAAGDDFSLKVPDRETEEICDKCGGGMVIKTGRFGEFLSCKNYPACKNIKNIATEPEQDYGTCDKCGAKLAKKKGKFGFFLGCTNYPECSNIIPLTRGGAAVVQPSGDEEIAPCEKCGSPMKIKSGRFGPFYACSGYPECKNIRKIPKK